jgi:hypothetical protein
MSGGTQFGVIGFKPISFIGINHCVTGFGATLNRAAGKKQNGPQYSHIVMYTYFLNLLSIQTL